MKRVQLFIYCALSSHLHIFTSSHHRIKSLLPTLSSRHLPQPDYSSARVPHATSFNNPQPVMALPSTCHNHTTSVTCEYVCLYVCVCVCVSHVPCHASLDFFHGHISSSQCYVPFLSHIFHPHPSPRLSMFDHCGHHSPLSLVIIVSPSLHPPL